MGGERGKKWGKEVGGYVIISHCHYTLLFSSIITGDVVMSGVIGFTGTSSSPTSFTLTCVSTGGPATTVTWTRNSQAAKGVKVTVLDDAVTAQYTHTLTVTGKLGGFYQCNVSNNKPSKASLSLTVQGKHLSRANL